MSSDEKPESYQEILNQLKEKDLETTKQVFDIFRDENYLVEYPLCLKNKNINAIPLAKIPDSFIDSLILLEDQHFNTHQGLDYFALKQALITNLEKAKIVQGGSTITQQLAKMIIHDYNRTLNRKIRDAQLAKAIEKNYSKDDILFMYINLLYFGHSLYGIENASQYYFKKKAEKLNVIESTFLAGLIVSPKKFSPIYNRRNSKKRHLSVLKRYAKRKRKPIKEYLNAYNHFWKIHQWRDSEEYLEEYEVKIITEYE